MQRGIQRISVFDSHTGGEPTRVIIAGGPDLGRGTVAERLCILRERHDRFRKDVRIDVVEHGPVTGDVAWGGNWFFLCGDHGQPLELRHVDRLTAFAWGVRAALARAGVTGAGGAPVDHVELLGPSPTPGV